MLNPYRNADMFLVYGSKTTGVLWYIASYNVPDFHWVLRRTSGNVPNEKYVIDTATSLKMPKVSDILRYIETRFEKKG